MDILNKKRCKKVEQNLSTFKKSTFKKSTFRKSRTNKYFLYIIFF